MTPEMRAEVAKAACAECLPGDVLIMLAQNVDESECLPFLYRSPQSEGRYMCDVSFEARALVIYKLVSLLTSWVLVLCEGRVGWVNWVCIERLEPVQGQH